MTQNVDAYFWIAMGAYFLAIGLGRFSVPAGFADWFDAAGRERYKAALRGIGPLPETKIAMGEWIRRNAIKGVKSKMMMM